MAAGFDGVELHGVNGYLLHEFSPPPPTSAPTAKITTHDEAVSAVDEGIADLVAVGRPAIANPDLFTRWETGASEKEVDQPTVNGGDERGCTDYPVL